MYDIESPVSVINTAVHIRILVMLVMHAIGLISVYNTWLVFYFDSLGPGDIYSRQWNGTVTDLCNDLSRDMRNAIDWA